MRNRFELLLLFSARLIVGYPAAWLLAMASSLGLLVHAGTRNWKGELHDLVPHAELIMIGFAVTVSAFALALLLLPL